MENSTEPAPETTKQKDQSKPPRPRLTLEEREEKARQKAARAAQELAKIRAAREREVLHVKACIGEIVIAIAKRDWHFLDTVLNTAVTKGVEIDDHHREIINSLYPKVPRLDNSHQND